MSGQSWLSEKPRSKYEANKKNISFKKSEAAEEYK